jgi:3-oxoacyl-[acyl-carrier protein] reductase
MDLRGKVCLVTGGSRGIGRGICLELAQAQATVIVNYNSNEKAAQEVAQLIQDLGTKSEIYKADVSCYDQVAEMADDIIKSYGHIDVLVNNAGIVKDTLLIRMTEKDWDNVINTNLKGVYNTTRAIVKYMMKQRYGKIVNVSSIIGIYGNAGQANYAAAKAGIIGFTKALAKELGPRNITVNAVAPGFIETDMTSELLSKDVSLEEKIPLKRLGRPQDVARVVSFLASSSADYVTGQVISIDGGLTL